MEYKWFGAVLIVVSCGFMGYSFAASHRREERELEYFLHALVSMENELRTSLMPLPELCRFGEEASRGMVRVIFGRLSDRLNRQNMYDANACVNKALEGVAVGKLADSFRMLGKSLGKFDLEGQLQGLVETGDYCQGELEKLRATREQRLRSYQTLWLCAGAALAILFV